jgi:protein disulfide-isomerase
MECNIQPNTNNKFMKKLLVALALGCLWLQTQAAESVWLTDLPKAEAQAKSQNKIVLMDFTGSDWCPWCIKFDQEVLNTPEFQDYAAKNVVLVQLDYPNKLVQSDDLKKANAALKTQYKIDGFPTLVVLNKDGKEIGRQVGYSVGGPKVFIAKLEGFKK